MSHPLHTSDLTSLPLLARGKVRDNYAVGDDRILMVASDRISAFDVIMGEPIPGKGELLTQMALFWFDKLGHICPNHLTGEAPESVVTAAEVPQVKGRSMLVKRLTPLPVEAVVRGYLAGSGWKEYQDTRSVCGVPLPEGLKNASKLPQPIYTPAAKAAVGEHDENITFERTVEMIGADLAGRIRDISIALYQAASEIAAKKGIIIADTKFEFGLDRDGTLVLMDEVLTPDSSRYWPKDSYQQAHAEGRNPPSYDKQFLRDWLEQQPWGKTPPAPALPAEVIENTAAKYREAGLNRTFSSAPRCSGGGGSWPRSGLVAVFARRPPWLWAARSVPGCRCRFCGRVRRARPCRASESPATRPWPRSSAGWPSATGLWQSGRQNRGGWQQFLHQIQPQPWRNLAFQLQNQ
jgi:phosphoribosylaminoimidazole-succinocarboxamide synthase